MTLDSLFHPRLIAVVGASYAQFNGVTQMSLDTLIQFKYKGDVYSVNPRFGKVSGLMCYPSVYRAACAIYSIIGYCEGIK